MSGHRTDTQRSLGRAAFAGFTGAYVMALAGYWLEAVLGISELNLAHAGLRYVSGGKAGWWIVGIIFHLIDGVLLGLLYAVAVARRLRGLTSVFGHAGGNIASGVVYASGVWLVLHMLVAMPFMGAGIFGRKTGSTRPAVAAFALHLIFGTLLGAIYGGLGTAPATHGARKRRR